MSKRKRRQVPHRARIFLWVAALISLVGAAYLALRHDSPWRNPEYREELWLPAQKSDRWKCIVIHHSADEVGSAAKYDRIHREERGWDELGYHFVIGNGSLSADGQVEVGPRWIKQKHGAHCATDDEFYNEHGIGICLVGNFNGHPPTQRQMQSLARLVRFLCTEFHIAPSHIYTHGGVTGKTECPGRMFDVENLRRVVGER